MSVYMSVCIYVYVCMYVYISQWLFNVLSGPILCLVMSVYVRGTSGRICEHVEADK